MTIDEYLHQVERALHTRAARAGLDDLRAMLVDLAATSSEDAACATLGEARDYAAALDAAFADEGPDQFDPPPAHRWLGVPWNLRIDGDWWRRVFNPADPRLIVPHAFGWGYGLNLGAVAVRLGGVRPDDVDDDTLAEIRSRDAAVPLVGACLLAAAHLVAVVRRRDTESLPPAISGAVAVGLSALPTVTARPVIERLAAQSFGYVLLGSSLRRADGRSLGGPGALTGLACAVAGLVCPIRAAVRRVSHRGVSHD